MTLSIQKQRESLLENDLLVPCYDFVNDKEINRQFRQPCSAFMPEDLSVCNDEYDMIIREHNSHRLFAVKSIDFEEYYQ